MLVCSSDCNELEEQLTGAGYWIVHLSGGQTAIERAKHESFDMAVVISTSDAVDSVETVLNLREIRPAMPIVVIAGRNDGDWRGAKHAVRAHTLGKTQVLSPGEFKRLLRGRKVIKE